MLSRKDVLKNVGNQTIDFYSIFSLFYGSQWLPATVFGYLLANDDSILIFGWINPVNAANY